MPAQAVVSQAVAMPAQAVVSQQPPVSRTTTPGEANSEKDGVAVDADAGGGEGDGECDRSSEMVDDTDTV